MAKNKHKRIMDLVEYKDRFDHLYSNLLEACASFHTWKSLQNQDYEPIYAQAKYFWRAVLTALQNEWLISLAKCFEQSSYSENDKVISVQSLLKHHPDAIRRQKAEELIEHHKQVIAHISRLRDHQLAHQNAKHLAVPERLLKQFPIVYAEVDALLKDLPELFSLLNPNPGNGYILDNFTKEPELDAQYTMSQIKYYNQKRDEKMKKFVSGEIDDPTFP